MRHRKRGRVLGRAPSHRKAMLKNLASALILTERDAEDDDNAPKVKGRIVTTLEKAKEVRPLVERCITIARRALPAAEAAEVVRWSKFAPIGQRGFDGAGADACYSLTPMTSYLEQANQETFVLIQVEHPTAVEQAEEILAVPGVDMLMLGPADFTVLTGIPGQFTHPTVLAAFDRIARAAKKTGKHWAATCGSVEQAAKLTEMGAG